VEEGLGCETPLFTTTQPVYAQAMAMGLGEVLKTNGT
jgi:putative dehydrogenase